MFERLRALRLRYRGAAAEGHETMLHRGEGAHMMEASVLGRSWTPGLREGVWQAGSGRRARHDVAQGEGAYTEEAPVFRRSSAPRLKGALEGRNNSRAVAGMEQVGDTRGGMRTLMGGRAQTPPLRDERYASQPARLFFSLPPHQRKQEVD